MGIFDFIKGADINQGIKEYHSVSGAVLLDRYLFTVIVAPEVVRQ